ncbi:MAG: hypothetical protein HOW73_34295 [Polyangiaceae bacterium]|nr:hypothetical protein [Polyangiaceae bacterium]
MTRVSGVFVPRVLAVVALCLGSSLIGAMVGCSPARFPVCDTDEDCKDKGDAKLCYDLRCVQCRYDDDCGEGRYCERKTAECKALDGPRAITQPVKTAEPAPEPTPEPTAAPSASAPAKK